jgi:bifunctional non-homologous end joining protein LigD
VLVRTRRAGRKNQWLLIKHRDDDADPELDPVETYQTSVKTGRTMDEIAGGAKPKRRRR